MVDGEREQRAGHAQFEQISKSLRGSRYPAIDAYLQRRCCTTTLGHPCPPQHRIDAHRVNALFVKLVGKAAQPRMRLA